MQKMDLDRIGSREYAREVAQIWDRLLGDYEVEAPGVRDVVYKSWLRCKQIGVDPLKRAAPKTPTHVAPSGNVSEERLRSVMRSSLEAVAPFLSEAKSVLIGTGHNGLIFSSQGDVRLAEGLAENSVVEGAMWDETHVGTNAIGTALAIGGKVMIHGEEHFCNAGKQWSCAADVIRDPVDRSILGVVDLTGPAESISLRANALIAAVVERAESELARLDLMDQIKLIDCFHQRSPLGEGLILVDRRGLVVRRSFQTRFDKANIRQGDFLSGLKGLPCESWTLDLVHDALHDGEVEWIRNEDDDVIGAAIHVARSPVRAAPKSDLPLQLKALVESSPSIEPVIREAAIISKRNVPVMITGETGTGKDVLANAIHLSGDRADKPFISVNCAAIPRDLIGVELFGYVEGAFTGTRKGGMSGRIEDADRGTLFLDEIGDMPIELQPYLLRVLESGAVSRLGESRQRKVDIHIIAATNQPLKELMEQGRFRRDLYYRLNVARLHLPPLRERRSDIPHLVERLYAQIHACPAGHTIPHGVIEQLSNRDLPGNIRELRSLVERVAAGLSLDEPSVMAEPAGPTATTLAAVERDLILSCLDRNNGNVGRVAEELSIPRSTLYRKLAQYRESQG
ncbi:sigma-54-dependent Fis family transcriptional regulator [Brucella tritici]|uniref:Sigma-54-dependent Fis family transcriptional regulator n=1 Tax=Brucella tritici TaxID=94626 RepID=A0A6L3Y8W2_9HYPH|nr:sigma-54-dependent Fis family transcriptional regulator [Brucella tritici]KAB2674573.1 sigma-54-dependent Fis family transcriptional regulator [Brucella tritici]